MLVDTTGVFPHGECLHDGLDKKKHINPKEPCPFVEVEKVEIDDEQPMLFGRPMDID
jgi:hypothetical protein